MHNNFLDKRRRNLRLQPDQVELVLPEHFEASYPKFISLLKFYYEFQSDEKATELLHHIFAARDISETDIELLDYIEDELLLGDSYFQSFATGDAQKRAAANFSNVLFRSKGTKFAVQWFFRSFYNLDVEIVETKNNVFKLNDIKSKLGSESLHYLTDDKLYQTFAYLVRSSVPISKWGELFRLFVHPAGMYLGAQLLISDIALAEMLSLDSDNIITTRTSPTYSLNTDPTEPNNEGTTFDVKLTTTNIGENNFKWYIGFIDPAELSISTPADSADFNFTGTFPDQYNKRDLILFDDSANLSIPTLLDSDEGEGGGVNNREKFDLIIEDLEGRELVTKRFGIDDVISSYTMTPETQIINEGDIAQLNIVGTNVPNDGNTTLEYEIYALGSGNTGTDSADSADFIGWTSTLSGRRTVTVLDDSAKIYIPTLIDGRTSENQERFDIKLFTRSGIEKANTFIKVNNVVPDFTTFAVSVTEDSDIFVRLQTDSVAIGTVVNYTIDPDDDRILTQSGSFTVTGVDDTYLVSTTSASDEFEVVATSFTLTTQSIADGGFFFDQLSDANVITVSSKTLDLTQITADTIGAQDGDTVNFTVTGTNIQDGITSGIKYYVEHITTDGTDFSSAPPTTEGTGLAVSFTSNSATIPLTFATSSPADGEESFELVVFDPTDGDSVRLAYTIRGNETYTLTRVDDGSQSFDDNEISENFSGAVEFNFVTDDLSQSVFYYWIEGVGITSDDFQSGYASSSNRTSFTTAVNGTDQEASIFLGVNDDQRREGTEQFTMYVSTGASTGAVASVGPINLVDVSVPVYTATMADIVEGNTLSVDVVANEFNQGNDTLFAKFKTTVGDSVGISIPITIGQTFTGGTDTKTFLTPTTASDSAQDDRTVLVTIVRDSADGPIVTSATATVTDAATSYSLTTNRTNDSANEGDLITFTFGGTNVPSGNYYYNLSDIIPATAEGVTDNSTIIPFETYGIDRSPIALLNNPTLRGELVFDSDAYVTEVFDVATGSTVGDFVTMSKGSLYPSRLGRQLVWFGEPEFWSDWHNDGYGKVLLFDGTRGGWDLTQSGPVPYGEFEYETGTQHQFSIQTSNTNDAESVDPRTYTMQVREKRVDGTETANDPFRPPGELAVEECDGPIVVTKQFTVYDGDLEPLSVQINPTIFEIGYGAEDQPGGSRITFKPDGTYFTTVQYFNDIGLTVAGPDSANIGNWIDNPSSPDFDPANYEIIVTDTETGSFPYNAADEPGTFNSYLSMDQELGWTVIAPNATSTATFAQYIYSVTIREKTTSPAYDPNNAATSEVTLWGWTGPSAGTTEFPTGLGPIDIGTFGAP